MMANRETKAQICAGIKGAYTDARKIANNTVQYKNDKGETVIRLHQTDIIVCHKNGSVTLNSGGWQTVTTKERMNTYLKAYSLSVHQVKHKWVVMKWDGETYRYSHIAPFVDGIVVRKDSTVAKKYMDKANVKSRRDDKVEKQINTYLKQVKQNLAEGKYLPSRGDCFFCSMHTQEGIALGDATNDNGHIISHLEEKYVPGSLLWNAVKEAGYHPEVYLNPDFGGWPGSDFRTKVVVRATRKYLKRRVGLAI